MKKILIILLTTATIYAEPFFTSRFIRIDGNNGASNVEVNTTNEAILISNNTDDGQLGNVVIGGSTYNIAENVFDFNSTFIDFAGRGGNFAGNNPYPNGVSGQEQSNFFRRDYCICDFSTWDIYHCFC